MSMKNVYDYAGAGFRIVPIRPIRRGQCGCGDPDCTAIGKHPQMRWQMTPDEWDDDQLESIVSYTNCFGVCVDQRIVIDIDPRNGGDESYERLMADTGIDFEAEAGLVVSTGGGGLHIYFDRPNVALVGKLDEYPGIDFKSSGFVVAAGSMHASGGEYDYKRGAPDELTDCPQVLLDMLKRREYHRGSVDGGHVDVSIEDVRDYLSVIPPEIHYDDWIRIGMAIHHTTDGGDDGFEVWDEWTAGKANSSRPNKIDRKWHSFGKSGNPVTLGTLIRLAEQHGYERPVTFDAEPETVEDDQDAPFSLDGVNLLAPPGFVGEVARWIDSQCLFPRQNLAVAAALASVGNIGGLRYEDDCNGITANLFAFCRADSATGKESILSASMKLHEAAGVSAAVNSKIKSEQEIIRALIRHQAAYYLIDEFGFLLRKIENASKKGTAAYLEGVIGTLMETYSKAGGYMGLGSDQKDELKKALRKEAQQCQKKVDENEDKSGRYQRRYVQITEMLPEVDKGLKNPFVSIVGFATGQTFDSAVNYENSANGFIGRSLLFTEYESNPAPRTYGPFEKPGMPEPMKAKLQLLYSGCSFDMLDDGRVEAAEEKETIHTTPEARQMLADVSRYFHTYAERQKGTTALEAVSRRGFELVSKVSLILAIGDDGMRDCEHVRWAFALVKRDVERKIKMAHLSVLEESRDNDDLSEALRTRVLETVQKFERLPAAQIANRVKCKQYTKGMVEEAIEGMAQAGQIQVIGYNRRKKPIYAAADASKPPA